MRIPDIQVTVAFRYGRGRGKRDFVLYHASGETPVMDAVAAGMAYAVETMRKCRILGTLDGWSVSSPWRPFITE